MIAPLLHILPVLALPPLPAAVGAADPPLVIEGARVLAPEGDRWLEGLAVLVQDGRVAEVAPPASLKAPGAALTIEADGLFLVPGLIDLHSHLLLHPYDEASWTDQVLKESLELRVLRAVPAARAALRSGFTTLRELGTEGAGWADVALRDAIDAGLIEGPRVLAATRAIVATGCYGPTGFDPRWDVPRGAQVADGVDGVRRAVREQVAAGADWIKVYADYRRRPGDPATPTFSSAELEALVDEARSAGRPVAAHATTDEAVRRAVLAGARTIEHGTEASAETLALMVERGVVLCPTLAAGEALALYNGWDPAQGKLHPRVQAGRDLIARARAAGVGIACGSDVGVFEHGTSVRELELLVDAGLSAARALAAATTLAAEVLGHPDLGVVKKGAIADLVIVGEDPLADISALRRPLLVAKQGRLALDRIVADPWRPDAVVEREVRGVCETLLEALSAGRFDEAEALFAPHAVIAVDILASGERRTQSLESFLERSREAHARGPRREWLTGHPRVLFDHAIATVWAPYQLEWEGANASGVDVFQLIRIDGAWRVVSLSYTNRPG